MARSFLGLNGVVSQSNIVQAETNMMNTLNTEHKTSCQTSGNRPGIIIVRGMEASASLSSVSSPPTFVGRVPKSSSFIDVVVVVSVSGSVIVVVKSGSCFTLFRTGCEPKVIIEVSSFGENLAASSEPMRKKNATTTLRFATIKLTDAWKPKDQVYTVLEWTKLRSYLK